MTDLGVLASVQVPLHRGRPQGRALDHCQIRMALHHTRGRQLAQGETGEDCHYYCCRYCDLSDLWATHGTVRPPQNDLEERQTSMIGLGVGAGTKHQHAAPQGELSVE